MKELNEKVNSFRKQIRKEEISSMMKKARYEAIIASDQQTIQQLISLNNLQFNKDHLDILVGLVHKNHANAIIHLGNLVIDRVITKQILEGITWEIGNNQKWAWLINVFSQIQFCTQNMFSYTIKKVITKVTNSNLQNSLQILHRSLKHNPQTIINLINQYPQLIIALCNHTYDVYDKISQIAFKIFTIITSFSQEEPVIIHNILGDQRIQRMLLHGFNKLQTNIRILSCQVANNFLMSKVFLEKISYRIIQLSLTQKQAVKLQISFYLLAFAEHADQHTIISFIQQQNIFGILRQYILINANSRYDRQIKANSIKCLQKITKRFDGETQQLLLKEIRRIGLLEYLQSISQNHQESTYMSDYQENNLNHFSNFESARQTSMRQ